MAAISISPRLLSPTKTQSTRSISISNRSCRKVLFLLRCHSQDPSDPSEGKKNKEKKQLQRNIFQGFEKMGKGLKENLSPQRKGDWKDITLMSLSFAVYVYISQKIVCAYCVWVSFPKQHW